MNAKRFVGLLLLLSLVGAALALIAQNEKERDGHWPWPLNGQIVNHSPYQIAVWDDDHGFYYLAAQSSSSDALDIDHAKEPKTERWCKIGFHKLQIDQDGRFSNCPCYALNAGRACIDFAS